MHINNYPSDIRSCCPMALTEMLECFSAYDCPSNKNTAASNRKHDIVAWCITTPYRGPETTCLVSGASVR